MSDARENRVPTWVGIVGLFVPPSVALVALVVALVTR